MSIKKLSCWAHWENAPRNDGNPFDEDEDEMEIINRFEQHVKRKLGDGEGNRIETIVFWFKTDNGDRFVTLHRGSILYDAISNADAFDLIDVMRLNKYFEVEVHEGDEQSGKEIIDGWLSKFNIESTPSPVKSLFFNPKLNIKSSTKVKRVSKRRPK